MSNTVNRLTFTDDRRPVWMENLRGMATQSGKTISINHRHGMSVETARGP
jgi:hypothetical protein